MPFQLDTNIPLQARGPQMANPLELASAAQQFQMQRDQAAALREQRELMNQQRTLQVQEAERSAAESHALRNLFGGEKPPTHDQIFAVVGPQRGTEIVKGLQALQTQEVKDYGELQKIVGSTLGGLNALPPEMRPEMYGAVRHNLVGRGWLKAEEVPEQYSPEFVDMAQQWSLSPKDQIDLNKPTIQQAGGDVWSVGRDGKVTELRQGADKPAEAGTLPGYLDSVAQSLGLKSGRQLSPLQVRKAKAEFEAAPAQDSGALVSIMGPDGKAVLVPRSQAIGKTPASTREVGRQVPASQAGSIADFDTSLDDLKVLGDALKGGGSTGIAAQAAASIPYVTQLTGWGSDAKQRQATIDRVKQVIGKTLEGGVLRKEDEEKYAKILPNIGDAPSVAAAKLSGLQQAIEQRRSRYVDSLEDANYDVSNFRARGAGAAPAGGDDDAAIQALQAAGKPVTPANIAFVRKQMGQ